MQNVSYGSSDVSGTKTPRVRTQAHWNAPVPLPFHGDTNYSLDIQHRIVSRIESLLAELKPARQLLDKMRRDTNRFMELKLEETFEQLDSTRQSLINVLESSPRNQPFLGDNNPNGTPFPGIYPDLMMRIRVDTSKADSGFLVYWLQSREVRHFIQSRASGASPTMKKINQDHVGNIPFPIIPVEEQRWVANHLDSIQSEVDGMLKAMQQDAQLLDRLEQSILEKAFQGKL
ncbi:MAG: hypothetical protein F6K31_19380 [Symploca sp. SIO2G7]|nr:hypothetical protein [Symploca sp. SIO2G7]